MSASKKYKDYESAMSRLEEITATLEAGEASLEDAIKLYTEGLNIAKYCDERLTEAEQKIKIIAERNGLATEEDFEGEDA